MDVKSRARAHNNSSLEGGIRGAYGYVLICLTLCASACSFFSPNEPEAFGDLQINLQLPQSDALSKGFAKNELQALERIVIIISEPESNQNPNGREIARRELLLGNDRTLRASLRVPLRKGIDNCFVVEVMVFDRLDMLYSGQGYPCFSADQRNATAEVLLQSSTFFISQPFAQITSTNTRLVPIGIQLSDSTLTHFEIITDSVRTLVFTAGRRTNLVTAQAFVLGDTTNVKIRAWRNLDFKGEVHRQFVYTGQKADVLIAATWNTIADFDLEVINPGQRPISVSAPGDSVGGSGLLILDDVNGFGPEIFEWRQSPRLNQGTFTINVRRGLGNLIGAGNVYVYLREGQANQSLTVVPFDFKLLDTQLFKQIHIFNWP